jgi:hypothetical protein
MTATPSNDARDRYARHQNERVDGSNVERVTRMIPNVLLLAVALVVVAACAPTGTAASGVTSSVSPPDPSNATFTIERDTVALVNGRAEREAASGSATKVTTTLADPRASGDVDGDGRPDTVVVLIYQPGGSGTFFYIAALLNVTGGVMTTPAVLLGDRIKVTGVKLDGRTIVVEVLDRTAGQALSESPSVASTKRFVVDRGALVAR